jgi:hypothetical protein
VNSLLTILYLDANTAGLRRKRRSREVAVPRQRTSRP